MVVATWVLTIGRDSFGFLIDGIDFERDPIELKLICDSDASNDLGMFDRDLSLNYYIDTSNLPNKDGLVIFADGRGVI